MTKRGKDYSQIENLSTPKIWLKLIFSLMRAVEGFYRRYDKDRNRIKQEYHQPADANRIKQIVELGPDSCSGYVTSEFSTHSHPLIEAIRRGTQYDFTTT